MKVESVMRHFLNGFVLSTLLLAGLSPGLTAELVMVEQDGCHWCDQWDAEISHIYPKTSEGKRAPLRRADIRDLPDDIQFRTKPVYTPTFVLVENGRELGRLEGYPGDEHFWFLLSKLLDAHAMSEPPESVSNN